MKEYTVIWGDTLWSIAKKIYGKTEGRRWSDIAGANGWLTQLNPPDRREGAPPGPPMQLTVGQVIKVPDPEELPTIPAHTIVPKDDKIT